MSNKYYYIFNKPYNVLSQFSKEVAEHITLQDFLNVPKDVYPVGRLDKDSEGLLLLTNDNVFKNKILDPKSKKPKTYWAQVDGDITSDALSSLCKGVSIKLKKGFYKTKPCKAIKIAPPIVAERTPPIRIRKSIPTSWVEITISEGKNRQVRKMCASVGFPCLRLIRSKVNNVQFLDVELGSGRILRADEVKRIQS